jgi:putative PIN family toxin of toxin-antitoxin system
MHAGRDGVLATMDRLLVLDTNIVLDLFLFADAKAVPLRGHLERREVRWLATQEMRDELARVLAYPHIESRLAYYELPAADVLGRFDLHAQIVEPPARAPLTCGDADDQKFIDLAVAYQCELLSKDREVLVMAEQLALLKVHAAPVFPAQGSAGRC